MSAQTVAAIRAIYDQVAAPDWAAPNLDGLADVLRDLSWLPDHPALITLPELSELSAEDRAALLHVLATAVNESIDSPRPVRIRGHDQG
ncbi:MAG: barstar family protein [Actinomycetota bacterium]